VIAEREFEQLEAALWRGRGVTVSIGVCSLDPATIDHAQLIVGADAALYVSKRNGRNCVSCAGDPKRRPRRTMDKAA